VDLIAGDDGVFDHSAVRHQSVEADGRAQVVMTGSTGAARATPVYWLDRHAVTRGDVGDIGADIGDGAGELVTDHQRQSLSGQRVRFCRRDEDRPVVVLV
jgi:hypothetical protein